MMLGGTTTAITDDVLDIGTRRAEKNGAAANGHNTIGAICPPPLILGEPGAFDIPNVSDVSFFNRFLVWLL